MSKTERKIAALFVDKNGIYNGVNGICVWDISRDARLYPGPHPVVAHPPCSRWCRLAGLVQKRWGHKIGDDNGCFEKALEFVRKFGGVLEHPAYSKAFYHYMLPIPIRGAGWQKGLCGGWSCYVEQGRYGHAAKKATWLYCYALNPPSLDWGYINDKDSKALVSWCGNEVKYTPNDRRRLSSKEASATPIAFRDVLIKMARSVNHENR